jgi:hypothetical protein
VVVAAVAGVHTVASWLSDGAIGGTVVRRVVVMVAGVVGVYCSSIV